MTDDLEIVALLANCHIWPTHGNVTDIVLHLRNCLWRFITASRTPEMTTSL